MAMAWYKPTKLIQINQFLCGYQLQQQWEWYSGFL